jgi:AbrB family looped-hinge helix DNA binding protein
MPDQFQSKVLRSGQVCIPAAYRKAMSISPGDDVLITRFAYGIQITPLRLAVQHSQHLVAQYIPADVDLVAELRELRDRDTVHD